MQFRKHLPDPNIAEILRVFRDRKEFFDNTIEKVIDSVENNKVLKKKKNQPKEEEPEALGHNDSP